MKIIIGKTAGFCYGVRNAVTKTEEKLKELKHIDALGELVHNGEVIKKLETLGLRTIENLEQANKNVIIRAHGITKQTYEKANNLGLQIFDFTCPSVLKTHEIAKKYANDDYFILLMGSKKHPEVIGTSSFCGENYYIIEEIDDIDIGIKKLKGTNLKKLLIFAQTTYSLEKFNKFVEILTETLGNEIEIKVLNTICNATKIRQEETANLSREVECMIIIGGKNSSNTKKLFEVAKANCRKSFLIETSDELDLDKIHSFETIGIMAGASTPDESIQDIYNTIYCTKISKKNQFTN